MSGRTWAPFQRPRARPCVHLCLLQMEGALVCGSAGGQVRAGGPGVGQMAEQDPDSDQEADAEQLLNDWLGELNNLSGVSIWCWLICAARRPEVTIWRRPASARALRRHLKCDIVETLHAVHFSFWRFERAVKRENKQPPTPAFNQGLRTATRANNTARGLYNNRRSCQIPIGIRIDNVKRTKIVIKPSFILKYYNWLVEAWFGLKFIIIQGGSENMISYLHRMFGLDGSPTVRRPQVIALDQYYRRAYYHIFFY